jgi:putative DNA primase/helicase
LKNDRFIAARMYGKIVNTYADIPGTSLQDVGLFKALVSGDKITVQNKYGKLFEIRNRAKLIFSGNNIPLSEGEDSLAYFKRWVILKFEALFQGDKQDRNLINKLKTLENLSGLLNLALVGIKLLERDGFENIPIEVIRAEYERRSMSLSTFIDTQCVINFSKKEYFIPKGDFYDSYLKYYKDNPGIDINEDGLLSPEKVEVELANYNVFEKRITIDKKKRDCYYGIITLEEANRRNQQVLERQKQNTL